MSKPRYIEGRLHKGARHTPLTCISASKAPSEKRPGWPYPHVRVRGFRGDVIDLAITLSANDARRLARQLLDAADSVDTVDGNTRWVFVDSSHLVQLSRLATYLNEDV